MVLYVMRHGTTKWNEQNIIQGRSNNRLSKRGIELVKQSAIDYKSTKFDIIYSSPLMRAIQTANIMNEFHNIKILKDERLIETDEGVFSKKPQVSLTKAEIYAQTHRLPGYGVESWQSVHNRMQDFVDFIKQNCNCESILIVTHDLPATCLENILLNKKIDYTQDKIYTKNFNNAEVRQYKI